MIFVQYAKTGRVENSFVVMMPEKDQMQKKTLKRLLVRQWTSFISKIDLKNSLL